MQQTVLIFSNLLKHSPHRRVNGTKLILKNTFIVDLFPLGEEIDILQKHLFLGLSVES